MNLSALVGNPRIKQQLSRQAAASRLAHAYMISGVPGSGRHTLARLLAQAMMCTAQADSRPCHSCAACKKVQGGIHPDVIEISGPGENKPIAVDQIRALRADAFIRPNEGARKVYVLHQADQMRPPAQNAMLKLLEEGPAYAAFLLLAENSDALLETVRSRCEELSLSPVSLLEAERWLQEAFPQRAQEQLSQAALDSQGFLGRAVARLSGTGEKSEALTAQAEKLADAMQAGTERALYEATMPLDKLSREEFSALLDALEEQLAARMALVDDRRRLLAGVRLVKQLRQAAALNASSGHMAGWLCAGMFLASE